MHDPFSDEWREANWKRLERVAAITHRMTSDLHDLQRPWVDMNSFGAVIVKVGEYCRAIPARVVDDLDDLGVAIAISKIMMGRIVDSLRLDGEPISDAPKFVVNQWHEAQRQRILTARILRDKP